MKHQRTISYIPYSFIPNHTAIIEALARSRLSGREFRIILFIMRQTDGYLREQDQISSAFFHTNTGIDKSNLPHTLKKLANLKILTIFPGRPPSYQVNPPAQWHPSIFVKNDEETRQIRRDDSSEMTKTLVKNDEKQIHPKDNLKKTLKKTLKSNSKNEKEKYVSGRYGHLVRR